MAKKAKRTHRMSSDLHVYCQYVDGDWSVTSQKNAIDRTLASIVVAWMVFVCMLHCDLMSLKLKQKPGERQRNQKHFSFSHIRIIYEASADEDLWLMQRTEALHTSHAPTICPPPDVIFIFPMHELLLYYNTTIRFSNFLPASFKL